MISLTCVWFISTYAYLKANANTRYFKGLIPFAQNSKLPVSQSRSSIQWHSIIFKLSERKERNSYSQIFAHRNTMLHFTSSSESERYRNDRAYNETRLDSKHLSQYLSWVFWLWYVMTLFCLVTNLPFSNETF